MDTIILIFAVGVGCGLALKTFTHTTENREMQAVVFMPREQSRGGVGGCLLSLMIFVVLTVLLMQFALNLH